MVLIGLTGKKNVGKDAVANYLVKHYGFVKFSFAQPIKEICQTLFLLEESFFEDRKLKEKKVTEWGLSPREMMQIVGTDLFRNHFHQDFWIRHLIQKINQSSHQNIVVSDVRFANESDELQKMDGSIIKIIRPSIQHFDHHPSETQEIDSTLCLMNDGTLTELYEKIDLLIQHQLK